MAETWDPRVYSRHPPPEAATRHPERMHEDSTWCCPYL